MEFKEKAQGHFPAERFLCDFDEGIQSYREISGTYDDIKLEKLECGRGGLIFAITFYNECSDALKVSLAALANNIRYLYLKENGKKYGNISIFLIADGIDNLTSSVKDLLENIGLLLSGFASGQDDVFISKRDVVLENFHNLVQRKSDNHWFDIYHKSLAHSEELDAADMLRSDFVVVQLVLCVKRCNVGKLDSHWWYYQIMCEHIDPTYCFQMDVGTCPANDATYEIWRAFEKHGEMAGASSSLYTLPPKNPFDWLAIWQYGDFTRASMIGIWSEVASGYVSIVPGQFSAFRWAAIKNDKHDTGQVKAQQPLDIYFKGLGHLGPFESAIYLTEDRVLCREIVNKAREGWKIRHVETAVVITDPCKSWDELLKQRKRWNSGALLSKIAFIKSLPEFLSDETNSTAKKIERVKSTAYHSARALLDWLFLGAFIYCYFVFAQVGFASVGSTASVQPTVLLVCATMIVSIIAQFLIFVRGSLDNFANRTLYFAVSAQVVTCFVTIAFALYNSPQLLTLVVMLLAIFLCLLLSTSLGNKRAFALVKDSLKSGVQYSIISPSISLMLWIYAVANVHNNSWGTKGLDIPDYGAFQKERFLRFRKIYLKLWLFSNLLFAAGLYLTFDGGAMEGVAIIMMLLMLEGIVALVTFGIARLLARHAE